MLTGVKTFFMAAVPVVALVGKFVGLGIAFGVGMWASRRITDYVDMKLIHRQLDKEDLDDNRNQIVVDDVYKGPERRRNTEQAQTIGNGG